ncbi:lactococcin 972 family bacteriocin [Nocardiopsis rhodophaea]|uniref:Lactococcin 972 family bacteriocin n=1 Tax=Nocardiopsis rhodophaea TaxID=280238 RepID=A0ABN2TIH2_9ACTN
MKIPVRRVATTAVLAVGLTIGTASAAMAAFEKAGGGEWTHGISNDTVYSNYYHRDVCHGSTAVGTKTVRAEADAGLTSRASAPEAWTNNQTYWRNTC